MNRRDVTDVTGSLGLGALTAFGVLAMVVIGHDGAPLPVDDALLSWSVRHRPDLAVTLARGVTRTGSGVIPYLAAVLAGFVAGRTMRRRLLATAVSLACLTSGQALRFGTVRLIARARPPRSSWDTYSSGWAFPSGHTTTATLAAGLLVVALWLRAPRGRTPLCLAVGCWGVLVGVSRVYLGVHWFTDVVGGWLFSTGWLCLFLCAVSWWPGDRLITRTQDTPTGNGEDHAPHDPGRRG
ncbi:phosphatase PAP2 family protein [Streptomyces sp. MNP-20]|uniref:phosphatase PAP2 family protein n=1 Tax=Streptomyces sp. MNP-20 TaxID=2721165 RepID=UPI0015516626|nr:phosphatase PAP2 family protein [Streptomyces sp. MNP-20]